ncbi:MAG: DUF6602 domain-containing protein [Luteolibacter sp.]
MDLTSHYLSITDELESLKGRVRNFIADKHWLTDGEWKEATLRAMIAKNLPDAVKIGRGFVITKAGPTSQCDILLYRSDCPVLFRDGELVFLTPESVLGIVEVKSRLGKKGFSKAIYKLVEMRKKMGEEGYGVCIGLFSYETSVKRPGSWPMTVLPRLCSIPAERIDLITLGCASFTKWWDQSPSETPSETPSESPPDYQMWHSYTLNHMSAGYFITNLIDAVSLGKIGKNNMLWFPEEGKESHRDTCFGINET